jgi:hypothetical protein
MFERWSFLGWLRGCWQPVITSRPLWRPLNRACPQYTYSTHIDTAGRIVRLIAGKFASECKVGGKLFRLVRVCRSYRLGGRRSASTQYWQTS